MRNNENLEWERSRGSNWEVWESRITGLIESLYRTCQAVRITMEFMVGYRERVGNPFHWSEAVIKLTGGP